MRVGFTFDAVEDYEPCADGPHDYYGELESEESVGAIELSLTRLSYEVIRLGHLRKLLRFVLDGGLVDIVFNFSEGIYGRSREAQVPAILEAFRIPYVGSDPLTLALCLDKAMTKRLWRLEGLPTADFCVITSAADLERALAGPLDFPLFVKPAWDGSSKGIDSESVVASPAALAVKVRQLLACYQQPVLVETYLPGPEYTVGLLGNGDQAWTLGAVQIADAVTGFKEKKHWHEQTFLPVPGSQLRQEMLELARHAYLAVECRDLGRVDMRLDAAGRLQLLEINPLPGLRTTASALPAIARQAGLDYDQLIAAIMRSALTRLAL
jgi:D-alanine-D-alanine ligase